MNEHLVAIEEMFFRNAKDHCGFQRGSVSGEIIGEIDYHYNHHTYIIMYISMCLYILGEIRGSRVFFKLFRTC